MALTLAGGVIGVLLAVLVSRLLLLALPDLPAESPCGPSPRVSWCRWAWASASGSGRPAGPRRSTPSRRSATNDGRPPEAAHLDYDRSMATRLSAPTTAVWVIALVVGATGILIHLKAVHLRLGVEDFWLVAGSLILLLLANLLKGL